MSALARVASLTALWLACSTFAAVAFAGPVEGMDAGISNGRQGYAGNASCLQCHEQEARTYEHTSHHLTSALAGVDSHGISAVKGDFGESSATRRGTSPNPPNLLTIVAPADAEPPLHFRMEEKAGRYYESAVTGWTPNTLSRTEAIAVVTGSGVRGQTYLYWQGNNLFELPVSYWTAGDRWINSPGYTNGTADFSRPVNPGCLECHTTYIKPLSIEATSNSYDRESLVTGISCETCHGPGAAHLAARRAANAGLGGAAHQTSTVPGALEDRAVLNPARFSRDRQVDLCALCHNGIQRQELAPAFSYKPGEPLQNYFKPLATAPVEHPDVHGDQVGLLQRSRCYTLSPTMTCSTCHDVHAPERPAAAYSGKCLTCHQWQSCGASKTLGHRIVDNCIDCHMPVEATSVIVSETAGEVVRATMRNHWIKVYASAR